jgi:hypothetical protein
MFGKTKSAVIRLRLAMAVTFLICGSMVAQDVKYNFMPGTNFSKYHTYNMDHPSGECAPESNC